jgi:hypothetical protein
VEALDGMAIEQLTSDAYEVIIKEPLGYRDPWGIGWDMGQLFGGSKRVQHRIADRGSLAERWRMIRFNVQRVYQSPQYPVEAISDGMITTITVLPPVPWLGLVLQAYRDHSVMHGPVPRREEAAVLGLSFNIDKSSLRNIANGRNWNFAIDDEGAYAVRGTVRATSGQYPERLRIAAQAIATVCGMPPVETDEIIANAYAPKGFDHASKVWDGAMQRPDRLTAAQFVMNNYII